VQLEFPPEAIDEALRCVLKAALEGAGIVEELRRHSRDLLHAEGHLDKEDAALYLKIDVRTVDAWMDPKTAPKDRAHQRRPLPYRKIGHIVRFTRQRLDEWSAHFEVNRPELRALPSAA
jgi:hypothetical protein